MPRRTVPDTDFDYHLVLFDEHGNERAENGSRYSSHVLQEETEGVTDVFVLSHGWKGDIPAAIQQYDRWVGVMVRQQADIARMRQSVPDFKPLVVCAHWPSLPWGVEKPAAALLGDPVAVDPIDQDEFAAEDQLDTAGLVQQYAPRIADNDETRAALATIGTTINKLGGADTLAIAETAWQTGELPTDLAQAYATLFEQAQLHNEGVVGPPDADQSVFAAGPTLKTWAQRDLPPGSGVMVLGLGDSLADRIKKARDGLLGPVRQVSFWSMKKRAREVGQAGVHDLLSAFQDEAEHARLHLMGHSFGCIVVASAVAGPRTGDRFESPLPRPVDAVFLVQGAMSLWSYADTVAFAEGQPGYFHELLGSGRIGGPLVTTQSKFDTAVGKYYPLGAAVAGAIVLGEDSLPKFGGIGTWGAQGAGASKSDILAGVGEYGLRRGRLLNVNADRVICEGTGPSGAHSDIAKADVAHLMWQAVLGSLVP